MASSSNDDWVTVNHKKPGKPRVNPSETFTVSKPQQKAGKKEPTAFDLFIRDPKKHKVNYNIPVLTAPPDSTDKLANGDQKKNAAKKKSYKTPEAPAKRKFTHDKSFEPDLKKVRVGDIRDMLSQSRVHFPDSKSIWLKDITAYINQLIPYEVSDPLFKDHPPSYPSNLLDIQVRKELEELFDECTIPTLQIFHEHCVETILRNMTKQQLPTIGYIIAVQLLAAKYPEISYQNIQRLADHRLSVKSRPSACLTVFWITHQGILHQIDLISSFYLWAEILFPGIELKNFTDFVISSLEFIADRFGLKTMPSTVPPSKIYFSVFDFILTVHGLPKSSTERLTNLLPNLRRMVIRPSNVKLLEYFINFLARLEENSRPEYKKQVVAALTECLHIQPSLLQQAIDEFQRHPQSGGLEKISLLLMNLLETNTLSRLPNSEVKIALEKLRALHQKKLSGKLKGDHAKVIQQNLDQLKTVEKRMGKSRFPWKTLFFIIFTATTLAVSLDIRQHGSFKRSVTGNTLQRYGVIDTWNKSLAAATVYSNAIIAWSSKNLPIYYAKVDQVIGPYLKIAKEYAWSGWSFVWETLLPVRKWAERDIQPHVIRAIEYLNTKVIPLVFAFIRDFERAVRAVAFEAGVWIQENVLTGSLSIDNLSKLASNSLESVQLYSQQVISWISSRAKQLTH